MTTCCKAPSSVKDQSGPLPSSRPESNAPTDWEPGDGCRDEAGGRRGSALQQQEATARWLTSYQMSCRGGRAPPAGRWLSAQVVGQDCLATLQARKMCLFFFLNWQQKYFWKSEFLLLCLFCYIIALPAAKISYPPGLARQCHHCR